MRRSGLKMKLTHQRMTGRYDSTPESVLDWLEEQLECRGIDAVVYTRYILSLLQDYDSDDDEEVVPNITSADINGLCCDKVVRRHTGAKESLKPVATNKWKHRRYRTACPDIGQDCWPHYQCCAINSDYERKLAVVQCLKSASEEEFGIESFVDELCAKLKNIKLLSETVTDMTTDTTADSKTEMTNNNGVKVSPKEQAMKYYAAFPALDNNCNEDKSLTSKVVTDVSIHKNFTTASDKNKWNGQKIIEFINGNTGCDGVTTVSINCRMIDSKSNEQKDDKHEINWIDINDNEENKTNDSGMKTNFYYCDEIETNVMDVPLVDNQCPNVSYESVDGIQKENDKFERLVNKFNRNIASIWSTTEADAVLTKNDNIWSFDSSFSSTQSSATPSPKTCAIDLWSALSIKELSESLADKKVPQLNCWTTSVFNAFTDDGFIDGNHDLFDEDINWCLNGSDLIEREDNRTSLQNHKKNSPFIEFNSNAKSSQRESQFNKLLSLASFLEQSDNRLSPVLDENLLTSPKTHFQPIRQDSMEKTDQSEDESIPDLTDKEVKLVICSDKCPNNSDTKLEPTYDSLKLRPISTSFGELASFMGPFNDFEWSSAEYSTKLTTNEQKDRQMRDKSTNTESECSTDMKTRLSSIVETIAESEPEYQDLYQMINEVLRNGISEEDNTPIGTSSLALSDDCDDKSVSNDLSLNSYLDGNDCLFSDSLKNSRQKGRDLECSSSDYTIDELFADELFSKTIDRFKQCPDCDQVFEECFISEDKLDSIYSTTVCDYPTAISPPNTRGKTFDSQMDSQYQRRHNENVGPSHSRARKPCSFFVDGNCKRIDCKYSHHISAITCKYWEEGFCFKAELCPFLHGYLNDANDANQIQTNVTPFQRKSYAIESESDFPSLSTKSGDSDDITALESEADPSVDCLGKHFFDFQTKSVAVNNGTVGSSKAKLPIAVFMKKKLRKRKDRNLQ